MADIDYPENLRGAISSTKQFTKSAGFIESDPSSGASYTYAVTEDLPTFFSFDLRFTMAESMRFDSWTRANKIFDQGLFFNFPIYDQYGLTYQEVRFLSSGVPTYAETGAIVGYSGCQLIIPNYIQPDADYVNEFFSLYDDLNELSYLDITVNSNWMTETP